jgi:hypothetical protein
MQNCVGNAALSFGKAGHSVFDQNGDILGHIVILFSGI